MGSSEQVGMPLLLVAGLVGMLLLAIAIVLFFVVYQKRLLVQQEKLLRLEFEHQKDLLNSSIQTQEVERKRIAADLHDSVGSQLSATKMYLKQLKPGKAEGNLQHIKTEALELLEETILNIRQITQNLLPPSLDRFGPVAAIEDLADRFNELEELQVDLQYNGNRRFDSEKEIALYRIVQELINNTLKHAKATLIQMRLQFTDNHLSFHYQDNGVGFDRSAWENGSAKPSGLGLKSIESRANFLNAQLNIEAEVDKGMIVSIEFDLNGTSVV